MLFLVIDDDELSRGLLAMLLGNEGHAVAAAASGEEALARLSGEGDQAKFEPDAVLADMQMSGVSGNELASLLRAASSQKTRLFAMSGNHPPASKLVGFDGFLLKPFTMEELRVALNINAELPATSLPAPGQDKDAFPALNETIYGQLAKAMPAAQLGQMYALCLSDARTRITRMAKLAEACDDSGYRKEAHTMKGGCGLMGATELYRLAEAAEINGIKTAPADRTSSIKALLNRFFAACDRLERILDERS